MRFPSVSVSVSVIGSTAILFCLGFSDALVPPEAVVHFGVGLLSGSAGAITAYPIDYVKSQLQTEEGRLKYKGGWDCAVDIVKTSPSGPLALYRGLFVNVIGVAPEKTIKLSVNSVLRSALAGHFGYLPLLGEVFAGGMAGATQVLVTNPLEVVKLKLQTSKMSIQDVLSEMKGVADLYQGADACVVRDVTFSAILFPLYAHLKVAILAALMGFAPGNDPATFWAGLVAGSISAAPAAVLATPADVVKTRLQQARKEIGDNDTLLLSQCADDKLAASEIQFVSSDQLALAASTMDKSFLGVMGTIASKEGPEVLFSGWFERAVRSVPQFGVTLAVFDLLNSFAIQHGWLLEQAAT